MSQTKAQLLDGSVVSVAFSAGSAATPSLYFAGDLNTGIYSPGADQVAVATNGVGRLFVDASGRIIIGDSTAAIGNPLEIACNTSALAIGVRGRSSDNVGVIAFYPTASATEYARIQSNGDSSLAFGTGSSGTERARIDSSGRLLVGQSTNPGGYYFVVNTGSGSNNNVVQLSNNANAELNINLTSGVSLINANVGILALGISGTERLRIDSSGRVGIGTTSPGCKIDIVSENNTSLDPVLRLYSNNLAVNTAIAYDGITGSSQFQLRTSSSNPLLFGTNNTERARIDSSGRVGIGTTSPQNQLVVSNGGAAGLELSPTGFIGAPVIVSYNRSGAAYTQLALDGATNVFAISGTERARIDSSGRLLVGTSTARTDIGSSQTANIQTESTTSGLGYFTAYNQANAFGTVIALAKSRGTSVGSNTIVQSGDQIGSVSFYGADGVDTALAGTIECYVDGTPGSNDMPGRLVFSTTADGAATPTERLRIDSSGRLLVGTSTDRDGVATGATHTAIFEKSNTEYAQVILATNQNNTNGAYLTFIKSRGTTANSRVIVSSGDEIGAIAFEGSDGTNSLIAAHITALVDGTPGANDMPGRLVFSTTADGASSPTERMRIWSNGGISTGRGVRFGSFSADPGDDIIIQTTVMGPGAGTYPLKWNAGTGVVTYDSSSRLVKENIVDCPYGINTLKQLRPRKYFRLDDQREEIGFVADEVVDLMPEFVPVGPKSVITRNEDDTEEVPLGVNYDKLTAVLTKALQEAIAKIESLEARLTAAGI